MEVARLPSRKVRRILVYPSRRRRKQTMCETTAGRAFLHHFQNLDSAGHHHVTRADDGADATTDAFGLVERELAVDEYP